MALDNCGIVELHYMSGRIIKSIFTFIFVLIANDFTAAEKDIRRFSLLKLLCKSRINIEQMLYKQNMKKPFYILL